MFELLIRCLEKFNFICFFKYYLVNFWPFHAHNTEERSVNVGGNGVTVLKDAWETGHQLKGKPHEAQTRLHTPVTVYHNRNMQVKQV